MTKTCITCDETKPVEQFYKQSSKKDGRQNRCKVCANADVTKRLTSAKNRKFQIASRYGLTVEQYDSIILEQENKCAICKANFDSTRSTHTDHDHEFGYVRGILCFNCNLGLGHFKDSIEALKSAITYLEKYEV